MKYSSSTLHLLFIAVLALALPALANAGLFRTAQQTKEPPIFGEKKIPPPPPPPPKIIQQPIPVPLVPGPGPFKQPTPQPGFMPMPGAGINPMPGTIEAPRTLVDPPTPTVKLQVRVAATSPAGHEIEYFIRVQNVSSAAAHHVFVRNPLPVNCRFVRATPEPSEKGSEIVWGLNTLAPGESREIELVLSPTDANEVKNCARVQFEHGQCVVTRIANAPPKVIEQPKGMQPPTVVEPPQGKQPPKVSATGIAKLELKVIGLKQQFANLPGKYQVTVVNTGDGTAENLLVTAFLPEKSSLVNASDQGRFHFNQVAWLLGKLRPGEAKSIQVSYRAAAAGDFCLKVGALADANVRSEAETCTKFEGTSPLALETVMGKTVLEIGGQTSYRIVLHNQGSANLTNVQVQVLVPREVMLIRATGDTEPPRPDKLPPATAEGQILPYAVLKELAPGERKTYEVYFQASELGNANWRVLVTADQLLARPVTEEESTRIRRGDSEP